MQKSKVHSGTLHIPQSWRGGDTHLSGPGRSGPQVSWLRTPGPLQCGGKLSERGAPGKRGCLGPDSIVVRGAGRRPATHPSMMRPFSTPRARGGEEDVLVRASRSSLVSDARELKQRVPAGIRIDRMRCWPRSVDRRTRRAWPRSSSRFQIRIIAHIIFTPSPRRRTDRLMGAIGRQGGRKVGPGKLDVDIAVGGTRRKKEENQQAGIES